jgi:hypothetical protein
MKRSKPPVPREADILHAILAYLSCAGILHWRVSVSAVFLDGGRAFSRNQMKGFPDVAGVLSGGRLLAIEVKRPRGRLSPKQVDWRVKLEAAGALYILATKLEDVLDALRRVTL